MSSIKPSTRKRLHLQGYYNIPDDMLNVYKYGIRFAYLGCGTLVVAGIVFQSVTLWAIALGVALFAVILSRHPFDFIYNYGVRHLLGKPAIPTRTIENKFACGIATVWLGIVILLFITGATAAANILVTLLVIQAFVVGTIDFCVPSMIYRAVLGKETNESKELK